MTPLRKAELVLFVSAIVVGSLFLRGWVEERNARTAADSFAKAQNAQVETLNKQIAASQSQAAAYAAQMAQAAAGIRTAQQAAKVIVQYLPAPAVPAGSPASPVQAPAAIPVIPSSDIAPAALAGLPPAPSYAILTPDQTIAIAKDELSCSADRNTLSACKVQLADSAKEVADEKAVAAKYQKALKGGTIFERVGKVLKSAACAGGGAAIAAVATRGSPSSTQFGATAAGAAGGAIACSIF